MMHSPTQKSNDTEEHKVKCKINYTMNYFSKVEFTIHWERIPYEWARTKKEIQCLKQFILDWIYADLRLI